MTGSSFNINAPVPPLPAGGWRIGANVPWSVSWSGEQTFELELSDDFPGLVDLVQVQLPGEGTPRFAAMHVSRHRAGMRDHLCHACGRPTLKGDRYIFPVESGGFAIMPDESIRYAGNVPPVHLRCAERAKAQCPHLRRSWAVPVAFPAEPSRLMQRTDIISGMEELAKTLPGNLRIVFTCYRLYGPRFSRRVEQMRQEPGP
jgi:hypothetical protein